MVTAAHAQPLRPPLNLQQTQSLNPHLVLGQHIPQHPKGAHPFPHGRPSSPAQSPLQPLQSLFYTQWSKTCRPNLIIAAGVDHHQKHRLIWQCCPCLKQTMGPSLPQLKQHSQLSGQQVGCPDECLVKDTMARTRRGSPGYGSWSQAIAWGPRGPHAGQEALCTYTSWYACGDPGGGWGWGGA